MERSRRITDLRHLAKGPVALAPLIPSNPGSL
jgi:hypothetical protein